MANQKGGQPDFKFFSQSFFNGKKNNYTVTLRNWSSIVLHTNEVTCNW